MIFGFLEPLGTLIYGFVVCIFRYVAMWPHIKGSLGSLFRNSFLGGSTRQDPLDPFSWEPFSGTLFGELVKYR